MPNLGDTSNDDLVRGANTFQAELTSRLIDALTTSSKRINRLTGWLIGFTVALVVIGLATLAVTIWG